MRRLPDKLAVLMHTKVLFLWTLVLLTMQPLSSTRRPGRLPSLTEAFFNATSNGACTHKGPWTSLMPGDPKISLEFPLALTGCIQECQRSLVCACHGTFVPLLFMRLLSYSEEEKNNPLIFWALLCWFYSNCYCDRAATKRNTNASKELSASRLQMQWAGQMTQKKKTAQPWILNVFRYG